MVTEAKRKAIHKYDEKTYDKILVRLPKGSKELIKNTGKSVNGYINDILKSHLEELKKGLED